MAASPFARPSAAFLRLTDHDVADMTPPAAPARHPAPLSDILTGELDGAAEALRSSPEELVLAALGRTIGRTIGDGLAVIDVAGRQPLVLTCATEKAVSATDLLLGVRNSLTSAAPSVDGVGDMAVAFAGPVTVAPAGPCHPIELRIYRSHGRLQLDWWYDPRRFYPYTVVELAEQFPLALIEVCSEATVPTLPQPQPSLICTAP
ncbi:hypothetical protein [Mycolicibacterium thermoresistibile]